MICYLVRHGKDDDTVRGGWSQQPLTDVGKAQADELASKMYPGLYWNTLGWEQRYPDGESPKEFYERISTAWDAFQKMVLEQNENVMLVTHGGVINVILSIVNGVKYSNKTSMRKIRNTELIVLEYQGKGWKEQRK